MRYHGWIVVEKGLSGFKDTFHAEYMEGDKRIMSQVWYSPAEAIEFFDKRVGEPVLLLSTPLGAYRVYTVLSDRLVQ